MKNIQLKIVAFDVLMILLVVLIPHVAHLPMFVFPFVVLGLIWLYLKLNHQNFESIGFRFKDLALKSLLIGGGIGVVYAFFVLGVLAPLTKWMGLDPANLDAFKTIRHNNHNYIILMVMAWFIVIPFEEIVFRGFIFTRIEHWFKSSKLAFALGALFSSMLFAAYHFQEGTSAVACIFLFGLFEMWLYKVSGRNLWYLIFFHCLYDTVMLTAIWQGYM